jgi:hypothetical protein
MIVDLTDKSLVRKSGKRKTSYLEGMIWMMKGVGGGGGRSENFSRLASADNKKMLKMLEKGSLNW